MAPFCTDREEKGPMKQITLLALGIIALLLTGCVSWQRPTAPEAFGLRQVAEIPLPGSTSRWDYESLDPSTGRLFIAHLGGSSVTVFDTKSQQVITDITGIASVHGVLAVPQLQRVYATATGDNQVVTIDAQTLQVLARTEGGTYPDGLAYDPDDDKVFVSDEFGSTVTVISARTNQRTATIMMGGEVGNTQYDAIGKQVFSAVQTRNQLVAIDPATEQVNARYDLPGCKHAHGLLIDAPNRVAFIACDENATMVVFDLRLMRITATVSVGDMPDVLALDEGLHRLYVAAESGDLAVFNEQGGTLIKVTQGVIAPGAHVIAVDARTHRVYLPLENIGGYPALRILEPASGG